MEGKRKVRRERERIKEGGGDEGTEWKGKEEMIN